MRFGASTALLEQAAPPQLLEGIQNFRATVTVTSPTGYRAMLTQAGEFDLTSLRTCVSAGETLPAATFDAWAAATGIRLMDGIGSTEMLHMFIGCPADEARPGSTGRVVPGYRAMVVDDARPRSAARHDRPARRHGPDRLPLSRRSREPAALRAARLEPDRRCLLAGRRRLLLVPVAHRRHDRLVRLQRRPASRWRTCCSRTRPSPSAPSSACPTRRAARSSRRSSCRPPGSTASDALARELQDFVKSRARALQVSARDRVRGGAAADADRQAAALSSCASAPAIRLRRSVAAGSPSTSRRAGPGPAATRTPSVPPAAWSSCPGRSAGIR